MANIAKITQNGRSFNTEGLLDKKGLELGLPQYATPLSFKKKTFTTEVNFKAH